MNVEAQPVTLKAGVEISRTKSPRPKTSMRIETTRQYHHQQKMENTCLAIVQAVGVVLEAILVRICPRNLKAIQVIRDLHKEGVMDTEDGEAALIQFTLIEWADRGSSWFETCLRAQFPEIEVKRIRTYTLERTLDADRVRVNLWKGRAVHTALYKSQRDPKQRVKPTNKFPHSALGESSDRVLSPKLQCTECVVDDSQHE
jgi:hypothetical protein